ncbi:putative acetyltransferase [Hyella patelloides LEGE 07179]|uniref:Putative acetyltransferase n=1 Tax=Hyella patelloides LEGE 07179 TaxID=945734 RepID=A0A563VWF6_9CYAN|nr:GNAT family N-acetyltransferase [Hyella patelloides]VEP15725.1 putative acetyltransferase [Hyella patelloides LEGE 07179]
MIIAETSRLILRHFTPNDVDALIPILGEPEVMRYSIDGVKTRFQITHFLDRVLDYYWQYNFSLYAVIEKDTKQLIGFCGLLPWKFEAKIEIEIAYRLATAYWGKGFATEAATAVRDHAWQKLGIKNLFCIIAPENRRSIRVAQKLGMIYQKDAVVYGLKVKIYRVSHYEVR